MFGSNKFDLRDLGCELGQKSKVSLISAISVCLAFSVVGDANAQATQTLDTVRVVGLPTPTQTLDTIRVVVPRAPILRPSPVGLGAYASREPDPQPDYVDQMQPTNVSVSDDSGRCSTMKGNPIDYSTGNKIEREVDFVSGTGEMPLYLSRRYSPRTYDWMNGGMFGTGWSSNLDDRRLDPSMNLYTILLYGQNGSFKTFYGYTGTIFYDNNEYDQSAYAREYIEKHANGTFTYHRADFGTELYSADGWLLEDRNPQGVKWTFTYSGGKLNRVTHSSGRYIQINWTGSVVTSVVDPAGNVYIYGRKLTMPDYGQLQSVTLPGTPATVVNYHYAPVGWSSDPYLAGKSFNTQRYSYFDYVRSAGGAPRTRDGDIPCWERRPLRFRLYARRKWLDHQDCRNKPTRPTYRA